MTVLYPQHSEQQQPALPGLGDELCSQDSSFSPSSGGFGLSPAKEFPGREGSRRIWEKLLYKVPSM